MSIDNDELKERLLNFIENEGTTQKFIAKQTKISESMLSVFKNGKTKLMLLDKERLDRYLVSKGY